jgi:energy-coupling factor transporter ATP-binding protein EcfA2
MRVRTIELAWFRGAADSVNLSLDSKSMVVYGENGSGKSSFVDAVEYVINDGRIGHLIHEYSGKHQEKGIINTHTPKGKAAELRIKFNDGSELETTIKANGTSTSSGAESVAMSKWDYRRTILRQDEVATFIRETKGVKYSALLPLLGLHQMEVAAENVRQLVKSVEQQSEVKEKKVTLKEIDTKRKAAFGSAADDQILKRIQDLHKKYCAGKKTTTDPLACCDELKTALQTRITQFSADQSRDFILKAVSDLKLMEHIGAVRSASVKLVGAIEPLIAEKVEVLQSVGIFVGKLGKEKEVKCPACGRSILVDAFRAHVQAEKERLEELIDTFEARKAAQGTLCDTVRSLKASLGKAEVKSWCDSLTKGALAGNFAYLNILKAEVLRTSCTEGDLKSIEENLLPLIDAAALAAKDALPGVEQLLADKQTVEAGTAVIDAKKLALAAARADALILFLSSLEQGIREEIRLRSQKVISEISDDIQGMWAVLHPGEAIENVRLYLPDELDKAIDIQLKFHGVEQDSPRLTLSEGYRNSLGLCIFLAMAKREASKDRPLFLDDVVVSFDRNHRGMIVGLLEKEFSGRQVAILTHDREWYTELRHQLDGATWNFKALMPYQTPEIGIRWSAKTSTFDDARAQLKDTPDSAGNSARKIMDIELALRAEDIKVRLPYLHREKNDHRTAHDFLSRIISDGEKCFKKMGAKEHEPYTEAIEAFREADKLLVSWGNTASHSCDVVQKEAEKLITACEKALKFFDCPNCKKPVYKLDDTSAEFVQCQCGHLRWRYGKV